MITASYFDGRSSRRHDAELTIAGGVLTLAGAFGRREVALIDVAIDEAMANAPRVLRFADGAYCEVADHRALDLALRDAGWREGLVARIQKRWRWAIGALAGFTALMALAYFFLLPWLAQEIAPRLPPGLAVAISERTLTQLDETVLQASKLPATRQQTIAARLAALDAGGSRLPAYRLHFRSSPKVGANAFALPDGQIVLLDELVALAENDEQLAAVLAHELGHVHHSHGMRQLIQSTIVSFVAGAWFGDISSIAASLGALALESRYSREFEREADDYAARRLNENGLGAGQLGRILTRLEADHQRRHPGDGPGLFNSHPDVAERVRALSGQAGR